MKIFTKVTFGHFLRCHTIFEHDQEEFVLLINYIGRKRSKMKKCMKSQLHFWNIILFYFLHHFCTTEYFFKLHNNAGVIFKIIQNSIVTENVECFKHLKGCL